MRTGRLGKLDCCACASIGSTIKPLALKIVTAIAIDMRAHHRTKHWMQFINGLPGAG